MEFRILGPLEVRHDAQQVTVRGAKRRGLLAFLLVQSPSPQSQGSIVEGVWGASAGPGSPATVQTYVSQLRKLLALDPAVRLDTLPGGYALAMPPDRVDAHRFEALIANGSAESDIEVRLRHLDEALGMWRSTPLAEFDADWADAERARLDALRLRALGLRADTRMVRGEHAALVPELESLVREFPLDEGMWARLMLAYHRCGRQADALRAFGEVRKRLAVELGIEPGRDLVDLERRVLEDDVTLVAAHAGAPTRVGVDALPEGVVTFLLTDIEGSTQLWDTDPEGMTEALARHEQLVTDVVRVSNGKLLKARGEGDSTVSVFAKATDAMSAALALQRQLVAHAWPNDLSLPTRIALHTGEAQLRDGDYFGGTLNRAARIRNVATGGEVVCSRATHDLVADVLPPEMSLVRIGEHELKGLRRREDVYAVAHPELPLVQRKRRLLLTSSDQNFISRTREVEALLRAARDVTSGTARVVLISGEAGIGKTTLVEHVARLPEFEPFDVLWGRGYEHEGAPPFWPWLQILRSKGSEQSLVAHALATGADLAVLAALLPELASGAESEARLPELDHDAARFRMFEAIVTLLRTSAATRPLMLVLDDLHWADRASLFLLEFAARQLADAPILFVATCRTVDGRSRRPISNTIAELARARDITTLVLNGFDQSEVASYVEHNGKTAATSQLVQLLFERTDGNPFFLAESVRLLQTSDLIDEDALARQMPESIRAAIQRQLDEVSQGVRDVLEAAAVIGRHFDESVLIHTTGVAPSEIAMLMAEAQRAGIVVQRNGPPLARHQFVHALVRDMVYGALGLDRRRQLHARTGEALARVHRRTIDEHLESIALHFVDGVPPFDPHRALDFCRAAGDRALAVYAYENAVDLFERAVDLLALVEEVPTDAELDLTLRLADALERSGRELEGQAEYLRAAELARQTGDGERLAVAVVGLAQTLYFWTPAGDASVRDAFFEEALTLLSQGDSAPRARLLAAFAEEQYFDRAFEERVAIANAAVAMARRVGDDATLGFVLNCWHSAAGAPENLDVRLDLDDEARRLALRIGDRRHEFWAEQMRFADSVEAARPVEALAALSAMRNLQGMLGSRRSRYDLMRAESAWCTLVGDFEQAERLSTEAVGLVESGNAPGEAETFAGQVGVVRLLEGRIGEMLEPLRAFVDSASEAAWEFALAMGLAEAGRHDEASRHLEELIPDDCGLQRVPNNHNTLLMLASLAMTTSTLADQPRSRLLYDALLPFEARMIPIAQGVSTLGPVAHYLGVLAAGLGRYDDAVAHFERAVEIARSMNGRPFVAMAKAAWADVSVRRGAHGDIDQAGQSAAEARAIADELGMRRVKEQAEATLARVDEMRAIAEARSRLGAPADRFVGRVRELAALAEMLARPGLVTITGPGGIGKTRLALEVSARAAPDFDRMWHVGLAGLVDDDAVAAAVEAAVAPMRAESAGLDRHSPGSALERTVEAVGGDACLILIDNCEHIRAGAAAVIGPLLAACPKLTVLATSRERLLSAGERVLLVPPLSLTIPDDDGGALENQASEALQLLIDRTQAGSHDFAIGAGDDVVLAQICAELDGIPLALELAAARLMSASPSDLLGRMSQQLMTLGGEPTRDDRHRTLNATIGWSYRLLRSTEQVLMRRLSVFRGGFTLAASEQVCTGDAGDPLNADGAVFGALAELVEKSLVVFDREQSRYRLLEPVRAYARNCLEEADEVGDLSDRHARWVRETARQLMREHLSEDPTSRYRLIAESDNLEAGLAWFEQAGNDEAVVSLVGDLGYCWFVSDWRRGLRLVRSATDHRRNVSERRWAQALLVRGMLEQRMLHGGGSPFLRESLALHRELGNRYGEAWASFWLGRALMLTDGVESRERLQEAARIFRDCDMALGLSWTLVNLADLMFVHGQSGEAMAALEEAAAIARAHNIRAVLGSAVAELGMRELEAGRIETARPQLQEAVDLLRASGDRYNLPGVLRNAGMLELMAGQLDDAEVLFRETIEIALESDYSWELDCALVGFAGLCFERGEFRRARLVVAATGWDVEPPDPLLWAGARVLRDLAEGLPPGLDDAAEEGRRLGAETVACTLLATPFVRTDR